MTKKIHCSASIRLVKSITAPALQTFSQEKKDNHALSSLQIQKSSDQYDIKRYSKKKLNSLNKLTFKIYFVYRLKNLQTRFILLHLFISIHTETDVVLLLTKLYFYIYLRSIESPSHSRIVNSRD